MLRLSRSNQIQFRAIHTLLCFGNIQEFVCLCRGQDMTVHIADAARHLLHEALLHSVQKSLAGQATLVFLQWSMSDCSDR